MNVFELAATLTLNKTNYDQGLKEAESSMNSSGGAIGTKAVVVGNLIYDGLKKGAGAVVGFAKDSMKTGMDFDSAMSQVAATMGKTVDDIEDMSAAAQEMGATTQFTATQSAEALNYLALAGYSSEKAIDRKSVV